MWLVANPVATPLSGWLPEKSLLCQAFSTFDNQNNQKIEEKGNRKSTVRPGMFRGFWKSVAGLRCRLTLSGYFYKEDKLPMKEIPIWEKSNLSLEEAAAYSGIGINKLREMSDSKDCTFVLWNGTKRLLKRRRLDEHLDRLFSI